MGFAGAQSRILLKAKATLKEMEADANFDPNLTAGYKLLSQQVAQIEKPGILGPNQPAAYFANDRVIGVSARSGLKVPDVGREGVDELEHMSELLNAQSYGPDRIVIDPSVVRGLGYYTGPVYEAELTFEITDEKGRPRQFGSVAGGGAMTTSSSASRGRRCRPPASPSASTGCSRRCAPRGGLPGETQGPVIVTVMDRDRMAEYQAMAADLRAAGIRAEVYLGNPKNFGNQLKYADKRGSPPWP